jgi:hypothetical protein
MVAAERRNDRTPMLRGWLHKHAASYTCFSQLTARRPVDRPIASTNCHWWKLSGGGVSAREPGRHSRCGAQLTALFGGGSVRGGFCLGDDEHFRSMGTRTTTGKLLRLRWPCGCRVWLVTCPILNAASGRGVCSGGPCPALAAITGRTPMSSASGPSGRPQAV